MSEIYLLNACKLAWEVNVFDFYIESMAFRIKILSDDDDDDDDDDELFLWYG